MTHRESPCHVKIVVHVTPTHTRSPPSSPKYSLDPNQNLCVSTHLSVADPNIPSFSQSLMRTIKRLRSFFRCLYHPVLCIFFAFRLFFTTGYLLSKLPYLRRRPSGPLLASRRRSLLSPLFLLLLTYPLLSASAVFGSLTMESQALPIFCFTDFCEPR
jgi:hypothetical protein